MTKPKTLDQLPHFHVLCPIRSIEQNGKWGLKQRRVYELDEDGNRETRTASFSSQKIAKL